MSALHPPVYLQRIRDRLREQEPGRWSWFASESFAAEYADAVRLELLQATYRMEEPAHPALYGAGRSALTALGLDVPVTFYQAQAEGSMNAALCFLPGEAHVVLKGPLLAALQPPELLALLGHELAHHLLWTCEDASIRIASQILDDVAHRPDAQPSHRETARRFRLYTELYADRGSLLACGDPRPSIACMLKVNTGLTEVDADAYVRQAEEIFAKKAVASEELTHPELFIRARALSLWAERGEEAQTAIAAMVQGPARLDALDLIDQSELTAKTRSLVQRTLAPEWFRTDAVLAHARAFFPDFDPAESEPSALETAGLHASLQEYLAYVLLDFAAVDDALGDASLAHTWLVAREHGLETVFEKIARDELKLTKKALDEIRHAAPQLTERAALQQAQAS